MKVLDTDVCIEILRGNQHVIECRRGILDRVVTTWITAAELCYGAAKSMAPSHNLTLVQELLASMPVLDMTMSAAEWFGRLKAELMRQGRMLADADLLIAGITLAHGGTLVTGNLRHYERIRELGLEDWIRDGRG